MHGQTSTAFQASADGHARHAGTTRQTAAPTDDNPRPPGNPVRIPPLADPQGNDVTGRWPLRSFLELGALPSAVSCARLHTRQLLWEWQLTDLGDSELLVSELVTNAVQITQADARDAPVRLWLLADRARLLILVWDASPLPPVRMSTSDDAENGRGLLLVDTLSTRWDFFGHHGGGKVVWAALDKP
jgi:anti-sigma regulatory factor (Ser/Thr protein kinase)